MIFPNRDNKRVRALYLTGFALLLSLAISVGALLAAPSFAGFPAQTDDGRWTMDDGNHASRITHHADQNSALRTPHSALDTPTPPACNPSFNVAFSPNVDIDNNILYAISAVSATDIWAVGTYRNSASVNKTLTLHWNGSAWSVVSSPSIGTGSNYLYGVTALASNNVWAVGDYIDDLSNNRTLILRWNGTGWVRVTSPNIGTYDNDFRAVAAVSQDDIWAVGHYRLDGSTFPSLIEHWNGTAWSISPSPPVTGALSVNLLSVAAVNTSDVWVAGNYRTSAGLYQTLTLHWDGSLWTVIPSPNLGTRNNLFNAIATVAPNDVWAFGHYLSANSLNQTLIAHWDGTAWSVVPSPNYWTNHNDLNGAVALGTNDVWTVGQYRNYAGIYQTLVLHWDGSTWGVIPSESAGDDDNNLEAVTAVSADDLWATGFYTTTDTPNLTLVERFNTCGTPVSTSTPGGPPRTPTRTLTITITPIITRTPSNTPQNTRTPSNTRTPTATITDTPSETPTGSRTPDDTLTPTNTRTPIGTSTITNTPTACPISFTDVAPSDYFYVAVRYLYCRRVISGYANNTFRPFNNTTRGQLTKIIMLAEGWQANCTATPHFTDVPVSDPFYCYIETAYNRGVIAGYADGTFRPSNNVTRAQLCKIIVLAESWRLECPATPHFTDVQPGEPFYCYIETAYGHLVISGYEDGTFRPGNNATRGQICKIVYSAVTGP